MGHGWDSSGAWTPKARCKFLCDYVYVCSFHKSVAGFLDDARTPKRVKNINLTLSSKWNIAFLLRRTKKKSRVLTVVVMSNSTHVSQDKEEKEFQEGFENFKEQSAQET